MQFLKEYLETDCLKFDKSLKFLSDEDDMFKDINIPPLLFTKRALETLTFFNLQHSASNK